MMCRPSQTPHLKMSFTNVVGKKLNFFCYIIKEGNGENKKEILNY